MSLQKNLSRQERLRKEEKEDKLPQDWATKTDIDNLRDRVSYLAQQSVTASLSAYRESTEVIIMDGFI